MYFQIEHIAIDYDRRPLSLTDNAAPVFTWAARHTEQGEHQSAYRLTVACGAQVMYDSGEIRTAVQRAFYNGEPLMSGEIYTAILVIKDSRGRASEPCTARFRYLAKREWCAKWITTAEERELSAKYFFKGFSLDALPMRATLYASGIGYQYLTVNGKDVEKSYLNPAVSQFKKLCYYTVTDVTDALCVGQNGLFAVVGDGWRNPRGTEKSFFQKDRDRNPNLMFGSTQLIAELELEFADGRKERICTDETWLAGFGATTRNGIFIGETYDATAALVGWGTPDFDGSGLSSAVVSTESVGELYPQTHPPVTEQARLKAKIIRRLHGENAYIYDFGINIAGVCELKIPKGLPVGTEITLEFTEEILPGGDLDRETLRGAKYTKDVYIVGESNLDTWTPRLTYHGFRYAKVSGLLALPDEDTLVAISFSNDVKNRSFFRCGDPLVNQLQECVVQTEINNLHHIATDCPQRDERMGWMNDATVRFEEAPYNFHMGRMFPKILRDMLLDQDPETGSITDTAPCIWSAKPADPVSSSYLIAGLEMLLHYGDTEAIRTYYEPYKRWNACLASIANEEGIIEHSPYGDWAGPADYCNKYLDGCHSIVTPGELMSTGFHYYNYKLLAKFAELLGKPQEQAEHLEKAARVQEAFLKKWCTTKHEVDRGVVCNASQGSQAFALWLGILPPSYEKKAARLMHEAVKNAGYRLTTGNLTYRYLMDMLVKYGYTDDAWRLLTREEYPSWGYMIRNGATTVWERFEFKRGSGMNSHDHPMYGAIGYWFYAHLLGVTPTEPGWTHFAVKPCFPTDLLYAEGKVDTVMGEIYVRWQHQMDSIDVLVDVPFGATATLTLPDGVRELGSGCHNFSFECEN